MNKPSIFAYLIGNPLSGVSLLGFAGFIVYSWWMNTDRSEYLVLIIPFAIVSVTLKAASKVTAYRKWQRQWDALSGDSPPAKEYPKGLEPWRLKVVTAIVIISGYFVFDPSAGLREPAAWVFGLSLMGLVAATVRGFRHSESGKSKANTSKEYIVEQCLPKFKNSPEPLQVAHALPPYAKGLLPHLPPR